LNWERLQDAHEFVVTAWTKPGPFRWEGEHYNYRYVNPWARPYQDPHPPIWIPGVMSRNTVAWAAKHRYPYIMLATELEPTRQSYQYYDDQAKENGYEAGTQNRGYLFKVHVDETEELAEAAGRKYIQGPSNPFLEGNQGNIRPFIQNLPGMTSRTSLLPTVTSFAQAAARGRLAARAAATPSSDAQDAADYNGTFEQQVDKMSIITGTPKTVIPKVKHVLETLRPGSIFFWDGDGAMSHDDAMRSLRLMGEELIPAVREMGKELDLQGPFEVDPKTNKPVAEAASAN
jgi:alkanesulfonate monooxygenase SsuD/methylene tetrahydromethanopterin reductase-like flavin-dependent oxidoreductase (luciferase family)